MFDERSRVTKATALILSAASFVGLSSFRSEKAEGSALKTMSMYEDAKALSADPMCRWAAAVRRVDSSGIHFGCAVAIAPDVFITAGHVTPRDDSATASLTDLMFGPNYLTPNEVYSVDHTMRYPGFVFDDPSTIDLGVGWTTDFIAGFDQPVSFAGSSLGEVLRLADYGDIGDPSTGPMDTLADRMSGFAPRYIPAYSAFNPAYYVWLNFNGTPSLGINLNVQGQPHSSGSPWYNAAGALCALSVAATNGTQGGYTVAVDLSNTEVQAFLAPIIEDSWARYYASIEQCVPGDTNGDLTVDGDDIQSFVNCYISGGPACDCADMNDDSLLTEEDAAEFVSKLLVGTGGG